MKEFSVPMALVDYLPVIFFLLGTNLIARDLKHAMSKVTYILFRAGSLLVFVAGALKATYKLLYALKVGELVWMSNQFFANQAFGFLLAGISLCHHPDHGISGNHGSRTWCHGCLAGFPGFQAQETFGTDLLHRFLLPVLMHGLSFHQGFR